MAADLSTLSDADLQAIAAGDMASVSTEGLMRLAGESTAPKYTAEQIASHAKKAFKSSARAESPVAAGLMDLTGGMTSLMRGAVGMVSPETAQKLFPTRYVDKDSGLYLTGQLADPAALAVGGGGVKAAQAAAALPKIGAKLSGQMTQGMLGGGVGGAAVGALSEDSDAVTGGMLGAGIGAALPLAGKLIGYGWDRLTGTTPGLRAKEVIEKSYGSALPYVRRLWQQAPSDLTAAQAAAAAGSDMGAALGQRAATNMSQTFSDIAARQRADQLAGIQSVAGGQTQQAAKVAREQAKDRLNTLTTPMREGELATANIAGDVTKRLAPQIDAIDQQIAKIKSVQAAADKEAIAYGGTAADDTPRILQSLNDQKAFLQRQIDSLVAYDLRPLDTGKIGAQLTSALNDPTIAGNSLNSRAMTQVGREIQKWVENNNGVIDAQALYSIRKNAVQSVVQKQLANADPSAQAKAAAQVLSKIEPLVDDAIANSGGRGWSDYLRTYRNGMLEINRLKLGAKAMRLFDKSPKEFMRLVESNSPETVQKIFKSNSDVVTAMSQGYWPLAKAGAALRRDAELAQRATAGKTELENMLRDTAAKTWLPKLINWKLALAREVGDLAEDQLNKATMNRVYLAMRSGADAEKVMSLIPAKERIGFLNVLYNGRGTPLAATSGQTVGQTSEAE